MTTTPSTPESRPLVGILLVVLATLSFAIGDTTTKYLATHYPAPLVVAARYIVNVVLLLAFLGPRLGPRLWKVNRRWLVWLRGLSLAAAALTMAMALQRIPVGEATAIVYLAPFLVMVLAMPILGERVSTIGWICVALGFVGVILIVRPGGNLDPWGVALAMINACLSTGYHLLTRFLSRTETTSALLFHTAWLGAAIFAVMSLPDLPGTMPPLPDLALMLLVGAAMTLGHFLFTAAYRLAPAPLLAPVNYVHLIWAGGLGWLVFSHIPDAWTIAGIALVAAAGAIVAISTFVTERRSRVSRDTIVPVVE